MINVYRKIYVELTLKKEGGPLKYDNETFCMYEDQTKVNCYRTRIKR